MQLEEGYGKMLKELNDEHLLCLRLVAKAPGESLLPGVFLTRDSAGQ